MKTKKIAYIAHPISGDVADNITKVIAVCRFVNLKEPNVIPFAPYLSDVMALKDDNPNERHRGLDNGQTILKSGIVDELRLYGSRISAGMWEEIFIAEQYSIRIQPMTRQTDIEFYSNVKNRKNK